MLKPNEFLISILLYKRLKELSDQRTLWDQLDDDEMDWLENEIGFDVTEYCFFNWYIIARKGVYFFGLSESLSSN